MQFLTIVQRYIDTRLMRMEGQINLSLSPKINYSQKAQPCLGEAIFTSSVILGY